MKPSNFKHANRRLLPPSKNRRTDVSADGSVTEITPLHVWTNGVICVSLWRMSLRERLSALLFGKAWNGGISKPW